MRGEQGRGLGHCAGRPQQAERLQAARRPQVDLLDLAHFNPSAHSIPADEWRAAMRTLGEPAHLTPTAELSQLACPTLFLVGAEDPIVPAAVVHELAGQVATSEVVVVDQAAHAACFEKPAEFNHRVLDLIRRRVAAGRSKSDGAP